MKRQQAGCPYCGGTDGCHLTQGHLGSNYELDKRDWERVYWFMKYVQLPFIHQIIANARNRRIERQTREEYLP